MTIPAFPSAIGAGKQRRAHHLFGADGRGVFVALDHAAYMGSGPPLGQPMIDIGAAAPDSVLATWRSEEHTSELQSLMRISYAVFCLNKKKTPHHRIQSTILN